jgi:hypothetical protein
MTAPTFSVTEDTSESGSYRLTVREEPSYLHIIAQGEFRFERTLRLIDEARRACDERSAMRVLVDLSRIDGLWSGLEKYRLGEAVATATRWNLKIAAVIPAGAHDKFGETVAVNRGANFRAFGGEGEALAWLLQESGET